jgi:hypothetical protein
MPTEITFFPEEPTEDSEKKFRGKAFRYHYLNLEKDAERARVKELLRELVESYTEVIRVINLNLARFRLLTGLEAPQGVPTADFVPFQFSEKPPAIQVLSTMRADEERFMRALSVALADQSRLTAYTATHPLEIYAMLRSGLTPEELAESLVEDELTLEIDLTEAIRGEVPAMERLVFLALYPSGRCRAVMGEPRQDHDRVVLRLHDPLVLIDPDVMLQKVPEGGLALRLELIGIEVPSYVG